MNADGYCRFESSALGDFAITGYANITGGVADLNDALATVGPISVSIDATPDRCPWPLHCLPAPSLPAFLPCIAVHCLALLACAACPCLALPKR